MLREKTMSSKRRLGHALFDVTTIDGRSDWWDGRTRYQDWVAAALYLLASIGPLAWFALLGISNEWFTNKGPCRLLILAYGVVVSLAPHLWLWAESSAFFDWSCQKYHEDSERKEARDRFKIHADGVKAVWCGVIALYVGVLAKFTV
jgi:hypothetical protein